MDCADFGFIQLNLGGARNFNITNTNYDKVSAPVLPV